MLGAEAARDFAKLNLDLTRIKSPIDGRVSRDCDARQLHFRRPATPPLLTTIVTVDPVYVYADFDEQSCSSSMSSPGRAGSEREKTAWFRWNSGNSGLSFP